MASTIKQPPVIQSTLEPAAVITSTLEIRQGPAGPPGGGSGGGAPISYPINGAASIGVEHPFTYVPQVTVITASGELVIADIHFGEGTVSVEFAQPFTGFLLLR